MRAPSFVGAPGAVSPRRGVQTPPRCVYEHGVGVGAVSRAIAEGVLPQEQSTLLGECPRFSWDGGFLKLFVELL